jgi:hypothetical protein
MKKNKQSLTNKMHSMSEKMKKTIQGAYIFSSSEGYDIEVHHGTYHSFDELNAFADNKNFSLHYKEKQLFFLFNDQSVKLTDNNILVKKLNQTAINKLEKDFNKETINRMGGLEALFEQMHLLHINDNAKGKEMLNDCERETVNILIADFDTIRALSDPFEYLAHGFKDTPT